MANRVDLAEDPAASLLMRSDAAIHGRRAFAGITRFARVKPLGAACTAIFLAMVVVAIFAPLIATHARDQTSKTAILLAPSRTYLFGTDNYGRDVFTRIVYGSRVSLYVGAGATVIGITLATLLGVVSAYFGGTLDAIVQRVVDAAMAFPALVLLLVLVSVLGAGIWQLVGALGALGMFSSSRVVRSAVLGVKSNSYVEAARATGAGDGRIIIRHILPNVFGPVMVLATISFGGAILAETSLSYLGLGIPPPTPSWGRMLSEARSFMLVRPTLALFPGLAITVVVFAVNMLGDALRDILDPRMRGGQ
jgi:peptide/nickel transport system permease protein